MRDGVKHLDRLVSGVGRADVPGDRNTAGKPQGMLLVGSGKAGTKEILDQPGDLYPDVAPHVQHR
jgi:hypothetical protein